MRTKAPSLIERETVWNLAHLLGLAFILCWYLFFVISAFHELRIAHLLLNPLAIALTAAAVVRYKGRFPYEMLPSFVFTLWFYGVYVLNGNLYLPLADSDTRCISILLAWVLFYGTPFLFEPAFREKIAYALSLMLVTFFGLLSWVGLAGLFTGNPIKSPYTSVPLGIVTAPRSMEKGRFAFFHLHPNVGAVMCMIALFCGIYLILRTPRKALRAFYGAMLLGLYLVIAPSDSRTIFLAVSAGGGLLAFLLCFRSPRFQTLGKRLLAGLAALAITGTLVFSGFSWVQSLIKQIPQTAASTEAVTEAVTAENATASQENMATENTATQNTATSQENAAAQNTASAPLAQRNLVQDFSSLGGRVAYFRALTALIQEKPYILWKGALPETAMAQVSKVLAVMDSHWAETPLGHMHNSLLQALLITGVPGLLIVLCFLALLAVQSLRLFFAKPERVPLSAQIWVLLTWTLLLVSMAEAYLFTENSLMNLMFFFAAGMVMVQAKERLPFPARLKK